MSLKWDPGEVKKKSSLNAILKLLRIEHTLLDLPFTYAGMALTHYPITLREVVLATFAVIGLRIAGMTYNNIADADIDRKNPRTARRPLLTGDVSFRDAWILVALGSLIYFASAFFLSFYAFILSPILYIVIMTYPFAKRFHPFPHLHLGLSLALIVFGGAIATSGEYVNNLMEAIESVPWTYFFAVLFWGSGFDAIYSIMDEEFDKSMKLGSVAARFGSRGALMFSLANYIISSLFLLIAWRLYNLGLLTLASMIISIFIMFYQVASCFIDIKNVPKAFNLNLIVGVIVSICILIDLLL
ncbi:UbiA family prenyltransferase [Fervidicoccus fontis]|uniref:Prenyltransferase n=2 Tax=Fervidicoccus fontis TaxID=683846 RepID=I0A1Q1_FERFK|nr:UbiA-like polyprenyltransferase [Fervidicoccus fontis]AFH42908.1 prenyltransferase [Fervidicoccus fontis Kam940]MBE9391535.1 UbiA family prenyltransferase [Fervidicoccus fontis]